LKLAAMKNHIKVKTNSKKQRNNHSPKTKTKSNWRKRYTKVKSYT